MLRYVNIFFLTVLCTFSFILRTNVYAQKKVGDYVESVNNNLDQSRKPRTIQYVPKDGAFFCINGNNRFTRALYGSNTDYRIETSDKPIFAIYKQKNYRSLRFFAETTSEVQLDHVEYCEASYKDGIRSYLLKDSKWGENAALYIDVVALPETEGAVWKFRSEGFSNPLKITYILCSIANPKLRRMGDMGADKPGCFEPSPTDEGLISNTITVGKTNTIYAVLDFMTLALESDSKKSQQLYEGAKSYYEALCSRISFSTPDKWINTLGSALVLAADGVWDGETWLHGAIGWRMPLAGWRAGFLGDVLGWNDRAIKHFDAYAASQVTNQPVIYPGARQDTALCLARAEKKWGTEMYSNGYICKSPNKANSMNHYDMNLNYIDELLWHFEYDADTAYMKKMWSVLERHLAWEKMNFDADNDHLYDAYCCIWASDALYYSDGAVTHSTAYNYRANLLAAKIASLIGKDPKPYQNEADEILKAMNKRLWLMGSDAYVPSPYDIENDTMTIVPNHWAEFQESMGNKRVHPDAALWTIYTPIDCGIGTPSQMYSSTDYVTKHIPHLSLETRNEDGSVSHEFKTISTSDWMPYAWSINNVASAEIMHTALSYFEAGNADEGYNLLKANVMDQMYLGQSPANFGQINYYDAARGECYRDFGDNVGISARAIIQGLFGIVPYALDGNCIIRPGFPLSWDSVVVKTPYLSYKYHKISKGKATLHIEQNFRKPLCMVVRINGKDGTYTDFIGDDATVQNIIVDIPDTMNGNKTRADDVETRAIEKLSVQNKGYIYNIKNLGLDYDSFSSGKKFVPQNISNSFNASVNDIFNNKYLSPRPTTTSLEIPVQGVGEWCHPTYKPEINDSVFRSLALNNEIEINGIRFLTPQKGSNIVFTSLWDNYPESSTIPVKPRKTSGAYLLMAGSTNHMQTHLNNAIVIANYADGSSDTLHILPPFNWCPIEQDYFVDGKAFQTVDARPLRICLGRSMSTITDSSMVQNVSYNTKNTTSGLIVSTELGKALDISATEVYGREIPGGGAQVLHMPLNPKKKINSITLKTIANEVVIGLMAITLE